MISMISSYSNHNAHTTVKVAVKAKREHRVERLMLRLAGAALLFMLLFVGFAFMKGNASGDAPALPTADERVIVVATGDTLWSIASGISEADDDVRRIVYDLKERNDLGSSVLRSGQTLIVPK
ncbi:LysM peptidoglycan-binding domain-containing protein [Paenibacillus oenotherae]|uniref:LysM peptidoglycan-binding domain-containing protein n=1 Tax=Paenibacillus oenotherae TaxID=1435645 RepID=A0ABS7DCI5_9BACL|nr:LysM peptidoglycan-binding domain-containing protein [Paenibacillus oenotherae]MBW7477616.1 LysM peptidoglycan-binding domain-containing protein [Paenibacillus oenotherae]